MSAPHDYSPPAVKQEPDDPDGDSSHYHHRKHRHTSEQLTSPSQHQHQHQQQHSHNGHASHAASPHWHPTSASTIQSIKQHDPLQAEVETLRKQNQELQAQISALQEKLKATSLQSSPSTSPQPLQHNAQHHSPQHQHTAHITAQPATAILPSPNPLPPHSSSTPPPQPALISPAPAQHQSAPAAAASPPIKEEAELTTQTTNVDGRSSCHRCKSQKDNQQLMFCTYRGEDGKRPRVCRKKYCKNCLVRWHMPSEKAAGSIGGPAAGPAAANGSLSGSPVNGGATTVAVSGAVVGMGEEYEWWQPHCRLGWCCPACLGCCKCAACQRKYQWDEHVTSTAAAAGNGGMGGEEEIRNSKDGMEKLQEQVAVRFRTIKSSGALQRSPVSTTKERRIKPQQLVTTHQPTSTAQANQSPTLSATPSSLHDPNSHDLRDNLPPYNLPSTVPAALTLHSRSESSTSLSSQSHPPLTADQTRQLLLNLRQGTLGPAQVAQLQATLESQLQQLGGPMGGGGTHYGSSDEERGSPTHSPYPESERDSPLSRASMQSYPSHATTHSAHSAHSSHPYYHPQPIHHPHSQQPPPSQPYHHIATIAIPPSLQPQPPGLISPLSASGYDAVQYGYGQAQAAGVGEQHKRSDSRGAGRKRSSGSGGHDYGSAVPAHAVPAVYHAQPSHSAQQAAYAGQPPQQIFAYGPTAATMHSTHQQYQQQPQQNYSSAQPSHSPQQSYDRITSPHTPHSQHGPTHSQSHGQLSSAPHSNSTSISGYGRENHTQAMQNIRDQVLASRQQQHQQPSRSSSTSTSASTTSPSYPPSALSPTSYVPDPPYYLQSPVQSLPLPFPPTTPTSIYTHTALPTSPYPSHHALPDSSTADDPLALAEPHWPLSPSPLGSLSSVEEGDVVTMMNESSVGGSGRGLGGLGGGLGGGDEMQLSGMSLGTVGTMPLSLRADTFTPPNQD